MTILTGLSGRRAEDPAGGLQAVDAGHLHVHQHHVRPQPLDQLDGRGAVAGLADDLDAVLGPEDDPEAGADQVLVVREHDPQGSSRRRLLPWSSGTATSARTR